MTQAHMVKYILIHIIPYNQWSEYSYQQKEHFHYIVTATGKIIYLQPVAKMEGSITIAFVGSEVYAKNSAALFSLVVDLWLKHNETKIIYIKDLDKHAGQVFTDAACWLIAHMPAWLQKCLPILHNLFTLRCQFPLI